MAEAGRMLQAAAGVRLEDAGGTVVRLAAAGLRALVNLRGRPTDPAFVSTARNALGTALPESPGRWSGEDELAVVWLGPDEWLIMAPEGQEADVEARLRDAAGGDPWLSVVDVTHNYSGFVLTGPAAREVLAKGCPLDLHPRSFGPRDCAQTLLAQTRALLRCLDGGNSVEIWVRNSFARYIAAWLIDAMEEFRD